LDLEAILATGGWASEFRLTLSFAALGCGQSSPKRVAYQDKANFSCLMPSVSQTWNLDSYFQKFDGGAP
jgi:hypothetical protein